MKALELEKMEHIEGGYCGWIGGGGAVTAAVAGLKYGSMGGPKAAAFGGAVGLIAGGICAIYR